MDLRFRWRNEFVDLERRLMLREDFKFGDEWRMFDVGNLWMKVEQNIFLADLVASVRHLCYFCPLVEVIGRFLKLRSWF